MEGQAGVADGVPDVAEGFGFDALVEGVQVGGLAGGDGDDDLGGGGVTDDPGPGRVHAMVGADFPGSAPRRSHHRASATLVAGQSASGGSLSRVGGGHFRRKREAPLIVREARHNSGAIPGPRPHCVPLTCSVSAWSRRRGTVAASSRSVYSH